MILAGDVGGTKTRLALYAAEDNGLVLQYLERYDSKAHSGFAEIAKKFLAQVGVKPTAACFGIPGPVIAGHVKTPNLPWELNENELSATLAIPRVKLVNDLVATTASLPLLSAEQLQVLNEGDKGRDRSVCAVLAPGTGCGQGFLHTNNGQHHVLASEGGHVDFAPTSDLEIDLLRHLQKKFGRVSVERVICGPGLANIYNFLKETGVEQEPAELTKRFEGQDAGAVISAAGLSNEFPICSRALDLLCSILCSQAGNVALTYMATGGVYLGGGIPPKISQRLQSPASLAAYTSKGRLSPVVKNIPLFIIKDDHAAVIGAGNLASKL